MNTISSTVHTAKFVKTRMLQAGEETGAKILAIVCRKEQVHVLFRPTCSLAIISHWLERLQAPGLPSPVIHSTNCMGVGLEIVASIVVLPGSEYNN